LAEAETIQSIRGFGEPKNELCLRPPATRFNGGSTRVPDGDAPAVFGGCEGADGIPLLITNPTETMDGSGDDASGGATRPEDRRRRRRLKQRGGSSTGDGSAWDLGQTEEDD